MCRILVLTCTLSLSSMSYAGDPILTVNGQRYNQWTENGWQLGHSQKLIESTQHNRAQSFEYQVHLQKIGEKQSRIVWEESSTSISLHPLGIRKDGTIYASIYPNKFIEIGPHDPKPKRTDGKQLILPGQKLELRLLHANERGIIGNVSDLNRSVPVYFVPFKNGIPNLDAAIELTQTEANEIYQSRTGFYLSDDWILWKLDCYQISRGKRKTLPFDIKNTILLSLSGELAVLHQIEIVDRKQVDRLITYDLKQDKTVSTYTLARGFRLLLIRDGIAYLTIPEPDEIGKKPTQSLQALNLNQRGEPLMKKAIEATNPSMTLQKNGFTLNTNPETNIPWVQ